MQFIFEKLAGTTVVNIFFIFLNIIIFSFLFIKRFRGVGNSVLFVFGALFFIFAYKYPILNLFPILILLIMLMVSMTRKRNKVVYKEPLATFEGGGIRRGLTPPEVAILFGEAFNLVIVLALLQMMKKGFIEQGKRPYTFIVAGDMQTRKKSLNLAIREKMRRDQAQKLNAVLTPYEEILLEFLEQEGEKAVNEIDFGLVAKPFIEYVSWRIGGYDIGLTKDYYQKSISRAHLEVRTEGKIISDKELVIDRNLFWILLGEEHSIIFTGEMDNYFPGWLAQNTSGKKSGDFLKYFEILVAKTKIGISSDRLKVNLGENIDSVSANLLTDIAKATLSR